MERITNSGQPPTTTKPGSHVIASPISAGAEIRRAEAYGTEAAAKIKTEAGSDSKKLFYTALHNALQSAMDVTRQVLIRHRLYDFLLKRAKLSACLELIRKMDAKERQHVIDAMPPSKTQTILGYAGINAAACATEFCLDIESALRLVQRTGSADGRAFFARTNIIRTTPELNGWKSRDLVRDVALITAELQREYSAPSKLVAEAGQANGMNTPLTLAAKSEQATGAGNTRALYRMKPKRHYTQRPLTLAQTAALEAWMRCGQNVAAGAAELRISRPAFTDRINAALKKTNRKPLPKRAAKSVHAQAMPTDNRGQESVESDD